jgi:hypothetical protein
LSKSNTPLSSDSVVGGGAAIAFGSGALPFSRFELS